MNKIGKYAFWVSLVGLGVFAVTMMMGWTHLVRSHDEHQYKWWKAVPLCDDCECWVHEDCWPGRED